MLHYFILLLLLFFFLQMVPKEIRKLPQTEKGGDPFPPLDSVILI